MKTDDPSLKSDFVSELVLIEKEKVAGKVSEVFAYQGDRPYDGRVQVAALGSPQSRYTKLTFTCRKKDNNGSCGNTITITFDGEEVRPSAFAVYFDSNNSLDALKVLVETGVPEAACGHSITSWEAKGEDERAVTPAIVMDLAATEGRAWFVHSDRCDLRPGPNWIIAKGWLCRGKMGKIGVLVKAFTPESEVAMPKIEDENRARQFLRSLVSPERPELSESLVFRIATALARRSQLKGHEIVRGAVADLLTIACPIWIKTPEGPRQLGETSAELGPTTSAKSQRVRATIDWLGAGKYVTGKQTVAGLTAGAEKMEGGQWFLKKGLLPRWDLSFIICDNMPPHYLDSQIESRRDGVVTVNSIVTAELWARVRLKLLSNPVAPFEETMYPCTLLKVYDSKMIARLTFAIYTYGSSPDQRYDPAILDPQPGDAELLDASRTVLRANLSRETTFTLPNALWPKVMQFSKKLELTYGCEDIPLLLRSVPYKIAVLSYSFALLEGYESPDERHILLSYQWLDYCARDIQLDKFVQSWRGQHDLSNQEYESLAAQIESEIDSDLKEHGGTREETYTAQLVNYLTKNTTAQRDELAGHLNVDKTTITRKVNLLKAGGLLRSDMQGYHFTAKGVRFFKRWLPEFDASDASNASSLQARGGVQPEPVEGALALKPEALNALDARIMLSLGLRIHHYCTLVFQEGLVPT